MKLAIGLLAVLLFGTAFAANETQIPMTITASTISNPQQSPSFNVPDNKTGDYKVSVPCDPAWTLQIGIRFSIDNGKTWDCDMTKIACTGFKKPLSACTGLDGKPLLNYSVTWRTTKGALDPKTKMQVLMVSNLTKTVTIIITFDPDQ